MIRRVLLAIRDACGPRFALLVKVDNDSCDDLPALLRLFQSAGVDGIELSGLDMARRDGQKTPLLPGPPAGCSGKASPYPSSRWEASFPALRQKRCWPPVPPFVSLSRALICQPDFVERMEKGQTESPCLACNHCYNVYRQRPVRCVLPYRSHPPAGGGVRPLPHLTFPGPVPRIGERARPHFCPPVPALKKENRKNRKKDLTPAEKLV